MPVAQYDPGGNDPISRLAVQVTRLETMLDFLSKQASDFHLQHEQQVNRMQTELTRRMDVANGRTAALEGRLDALQKEVTTIQTRLREEDAVRNALEKERSPRSIILVSWPKAVGAGTVIGALAATLIEAIRLGWLR